MNFIKVWQRIKRGWFYYRAPILQGSWIIIIISNSNNNNNNNNLSLKLNSWWGRAQIKLNHNRTNLHVGFWWEGKTGEQPLGPEYRTNKLNPHMTAGTRTEPGHIGGRRVLSTLHQPCSWPLLNDYSSLLTDYLLLNFIKWSQEVLKKYF